MTGNTNELMPIVASPKIFAWDKNLSWPLTRHWLYLLALFGNGAEGLWVYSPFQETDCPIRNYFPASSACFRWHDTPECEHFLSKDPEKVGETGSATWPDWAWILGDPRILQEPSRVGEGTGQ